MKKFKFIIIPTVFMLLIAACSKDITLDIPEPEIKIVIEGYIENGKNPYIIVTKNTPYFGTLDSATLVNLLVQDAVVTVSDGNITAPCAFTFDPTIFPYFLYKTNAIVGEVGKTYYLSVTANGKTYTAQTTIPGLNPLDSLWYKSETNLDSLGYIWGHGNDPDTLGNYYRLLAKRIGKDDTYVATFPSSMDDKFINGVSFDFNLSRGAKSNSQALDDNNIEAGFFKRGDTIVVKFCGIDKAHYLFWRTAEEIIYGGSNPFTNPISVKTNISNGGLGIWGGQNAVYDTIYAQ
ncbi:MAG: DUF4249 domain-containing protein [Bacteroidota bacterium]